MAPSHLVEYCRDGTPYGVRTLITEKAGPTPIEPMRLMSERTRGKGYIKELSDNRFEVRAKAQHCGVVNRNNRLYTVPVWEQHLIPGAKFCVRIEGRGVIGHLEHPDDGKSAFPLGAILITEASPPDENGEIWVTFETLSTPPGRIVEAYIRCRVRFGLSSRGNGSVQSRNGVDEVQEDFEPITWDCVIDESTAGAEVPADEKLREGLDTAGNLDDLRRFLIEAKRELDSYVRSLNERAGGDRAKAIALAESDTRRNVASFQITEMENMDVPPSGFSRYLLAFEDGSAHYRAYQGSTGQWEVWVHPHNLPAQRLASRIPTLTAAQAVAENHYRLVLVSGAQSAQAHVQSSNVIARDAMRQAQPVRAPRRPGIGGMAGMMGRHSGPAGPGPASSRVTNHPFEAVNVVWPSLLEKLRGGWGDDISAPYSGTVVMADFKTEALRESGLSAIRAAGIFASSIPGTPGVVTHVTHEDASQAVTYVRTVLETSGIKQARLAATGKIRQGNIVEASMGIGITEYAPDKGNPGGMGGGNTVPDEPEDVYGDSSTISPRATLEDPEDLDLDLDVNEGGMPLDYDYDEGYMSDATSRMPMDYAGMGEQDDDDDYDDDMENEAYRPTGRMPRRDRANQRRNAARRAAKRPAPAAAPATPQREEYDDDDDMEYEAYDSDDDMDYEEENIMGYSESHLSELAGSQRAAFFGKMLSKHEAPKGSKAAKDKTHGTKKGAAGWKRRLAKYGKDNNLKISGGIQQPDRRAKKKSKKESHQVVFNRYLQETGEQVGGVRITFNERNIPTAYEFYNNDGILESVTDSFGNILHSSISEDAAPGSRGVEVWEDRRGKLVNPRNLIRRAHGLSENDLDARHGGSTGVVMKNDNFKGREGPEFNINGMPDPGDRGQDGSAQTPGDYDDASEEGDGEHVAKGTWPTSGKPINVESVEDRQNLLDKVAFLESEVDRYEDICQEQHEQIHGLREAARQSELERHRAEALVAHPELAIIENRLLRCESISELNDEVSSVLSLVETVRTDPVMPAPLNEDGSLTDPNGVSSRLPIDRVPTGPLNESIIPSPERLDEGVRLGSGDVVSRVAAAKRRRRSRQS